MSEGFYQPGLKYRVEGFCPFNNISQTLKNKVLREEPISSVLVKLSTDLREKPKPISF